MHLQALRRKPGVVTIHHLKPIPHLQGRQPTGAVTVHQVAAAVRHPITGVQVRESARPEVGEATFQEVPEAQEVLVLVQEAAEETGDKSLF